MMFLPYEIILFPNNDASVFPQETQPFPAQLTSCHSKVTFEWSIDNHLFQYILQLQNNLLTFNF